MNSEIDLTVITNILMADGIGRQGIGLIECLQDDLNINTIQLPPRSYKDIAPKTLKTLMQPFNSFGKVSFWTHIIGMNEDCINMHSKLQSPIKIAYSMFESDLIPELWTKVLNTYYDFVVVPDDYLVGVYKNSGVKIPIFVVPLGIYVEDLLNKPNKINKNDIFTFGMSAGFWKRKNHIKLLEAFAMNFANNENCKLKLHGRFGPYKDIVESAVKKINLKNVEMYSSVFSNAQYNDFMDSVDCYVFPSMGEGFSITPRETIALGKPCILTNNTAHKTICDSGCVIPVASNKKTPAVYEVFNNKTIGNFYDCGVDDLAAAMKNVYNNYEMYLEKSISSRNWAKQYLWSELKPIYLNMLRPTNITLSKSNKIDKTSFQTNDNNLYKKMKKVFS